jgi:cell division protein FtsI (penicillin-binding protein 3)
LSSKSTIFWRVYLAFFTLALFALAILAKIAVIQTVEGETWRALADSLTTQYVEVAPNRGNIYASDGRLLATSLYEYNLHMDLGTAYIKELHAQGLLWSELDALAGALAQYFNGEGEKTKWQWSHELKSAFEQGRRYHPIRKTVDHIQLKQIRKFPLFSLGQYKGGLIVEQGTMRKRPYNLLAKRTIGYHGDKMVGLEGGFDSHLAGVKGQRLLQRVSYKEWIPIHDANEVEPENGKDLYTTLDIYIQDFVEQSLRQQLAKSKADHGCAIVMEVSTGKVLAISNLKTYDDGQSVDEIYNYAIGEATEPGSTFKLASLLALLEGGYMQLDDTVRTGKGSQNFHNLVMYDSKIGGHGTISLQKSFEVSSNIGFANAVGQHFGPNESRFTEFLQSLRLHETLDLPMQGEGQPLIKTPGSTGWSGTTLPWMAHGYELMLTPLQTLMIYNAVANNGILMEPLFVTAIKEVNHTLTTFEPRVRVQGVLSQRTVALAKEALVGVIESREGTAHNLYKPYLSLAGKTGTAVLEKTEKGEKIYQASFAGFFPAENPKYSCIVVINNPDRSTWRYSGSDVAGPVFLGIAQNLYSYDISLQQPKYEVAMENIQARPTFLAATIDDLSNIYQGLGIDVKTPAEATLWAEPQLQGKSIALIAKDMPTHTLPNLKGLSLSDALYLCENLGIQVQHRGMGNVYRQSPGPGTDLQKVSKVYIDLN